jgi:hypothetical protein
METFSIFTQGIFQLFVRTRLFFLTMTKIYLILRAKQARLVHHFSRFLPSLIQTRAAL